MKEQVKEILLKHQVDQLVTEHIAACYAKPQEGGTAWFIDNLVNDLDALLSPKGEKLELWCHLCRDIPQNQDTEECWACGNRLTPKPIPKGEKPPVLDSENVLGSPLWRPLHDILIDWNEGRMKLEEQGLPGLISNLSKGENNIKAIKQMVKVVAQAQYDLMLPYIEQARKETEAISYSKGVVDGRKQVFEEIDSEFSIEGNRIPVPLASDRFIIRRDAWQALKDKW